MTPILLMLVAQNYSIVKPVETKTATFITPAIFTLQEAELQRPNQKAELVFETLEIQTFGPVQRQVIEKP